MDLKIEGNRFDFKAGYRICVFPIYCCDQPWKSESLNVETLILFTGQGCKSRSDM